MRYYVYIIYIVLSCRLVAQPPAQGPAVRIVVDAAGHGDFGTIQEALNSLPADAATPRTIFIRKGIYHEKVFIGKNNLILEGEDRERTILTCSLARDAWRCDHRDDWGVATINLRGSDITLKNLSIQNTYGFDNTAAQTVIGCNADSLNHRKTISRQGHQMALRSFQTTRLRVIGCILKAYGGDIHCSLAATMADQDIYLVPTNNSIQWGRRVYYFDCHKEGAAYAWYANNLDQAPGSPDPAGIDPSWVFKGKWAPLKDGRP